MQQGISDQKMVIKLENNTEGQFFSIIYLRVNPNSYKFVPFNRDNTKDDKSTY